MSEADTTPVAADTGSTGVSWLSGAQDWVDLIGGVASAGAGVYKAIEDAKAAKIAAKATATASGAAAVQPAPATGAAAPNGGASGLSTTAVAGIGLAAAAALGLVLVIALKK